MRDFFTLKLGAKSPKVANDNEFDKFYRKGVNAADIYMKFKKGVEIQFRGFDGPKALTGWQGEVKDQEQTKEKLVKDLLI